MSNLSEQISGLNVDERSKAIFQKIANELLSIIAKKDKIITEQALLIKNSSLSTSLDVGKKKGFQLDKNGTKRGIISSLCAKFAKKSTDLKPVNNPDRVKKIMLTRCSCGSTNLKMTGSYEARQEFDIEIKRIVTEYRLINCQCGSCGLISKPESNLPRSAFYSEKVKPHDSKSQEMANKVSSKIQDKLPDGCSVVVLDQATGQPKYPSSITPEGITLFVQN